MAAEHPYPEVLVPLERDHGVWKGIMAGAAGGLVASWVMTQFQELAKRVTEPEEQRNEQHSMERGGEESAEPQEGGQGSEDATVKTAERVSEKVFHHELTEDEKRLAGPAVHYAFGAAMGALYGGLAEVSPAVSRGAGMPFGTAVWLAADEVGVPAMGLAKKPTEYPVTVHASALGAHLVYGVTTDLVRRLMLLAMA